MDYEQEESGKKNKNKKQKIKE